MRSAVAVPEGRLVTTRIASILITDDGKLFAGAVTPDAVRPPRERPPPARDSPRNDARRTATKHN